MTAGSADVRRKTVGLDTLATDTLPAGLSVPAALLGETELAPTTTLPTPGGISISPRATGPRVTVLPRVEMVGSEPRVVSEARDRYVSEKKLGEGGLGEADLGLEQGTDTEEGLLVGTAEAHEDGGIGCAQAGEHATGVRWLLQVARGQWPGARRSGAFGRLRLLDNGKLRVPESRPKSDSDRPPAAGNSDRPKPAV